jgi:hypothetical protein
LHVVANEVVTFWLISTSDCFGNFVKQEGQMGHSIMENVFSIFKKTFWEGFYQI